MKTKQIIHLIKANFNMIGDHFAQTRQNLWPDLLEFWPPIRVQDRVLDLGCANGRVLSKLKHHQRYLGVDIAPNLLGIAKKAYPQAKFLTGDFTQAQTWTKIGQANQKRPFQVVLFIAALHHVPPSKQTYILQQIFSQLEPGGYLLLSVWNLWQPRFLKLHLSQLGQKLINLQPQMLWVKYQTKTKQVKRYHHAFFPGQLARMLKQAGFEIQKHSSGSKNLIFLCQKLI